MTEDEFRLIRDLIYDYCGIFLPDTMKYLVARRLVSRLHALGLSTFRDYYRALKYGRDSQHEFDQVVERITTNETYFFREDYQLKAFIEEILPAVIEVRDPCDTVRIWSAGCSSGEEPYTIAILVSESSYSSGRKFEIFGNDISRKVLKIARDAHYHAASFRQTDERYVRRYFSKEGSGYRLRDEIKHRVTFGHLNLMDEGAMAVISNVDILFCRNVMIYFGEESRSRVVDMFHRRLRPGGYLLLGHSESLINVSTGFELVPLRNDIVYRKPLDSP